MDKNIKWCLLIRNIQKIDQADQGWVGGEERYRKMLALGRNLLAADLQPRKLATLKQVSYLDES
jgi:hypothetical protein